MVDPRYDAVRLRHTSSSATGHHVRFLNPSLNLWLQISVFLSGCLKLALHYLSARGTCVQPECGTLISCSRRQFPHAQFVRSYGLRIG
jgi:hypothetical protein